MAKTVSSASVISTSSQKIAEGNEITTSSNNSSNSITYNGMNVYIADYCPVCHRVTKVQTSDGTVININTGEETSAAEEESSSTDTSSNTKKYTNNPTESNTTTVLAKNVIEDSTHRFITDETLQKLITVIDQYMSKIIYDVDNDGVVDISKTTKNVNSITWDKIKDIPEPLDDLQGLKNLLIHHHHHNNLEVLSKFYEDEKGLPLWKGKEWPYPQSAKPHQLSAPYLRNIFIALSDPKNAQIGDIWLEVETFDSPLIKGLYIKKEDGTWYRWIASDIKADIIEKIQRALLNLSHESLANLYGGKTGEHYHLSEEDYKFLEDLKVKSTPKEDEPPEKAQEIVIISKHEYNLLIEFLVKYEKGEIVEAESADYKTLTEEEYDLVQKIIKDYKKEHIDPWIEPDDGTGTDDIDDMSTDKSSPREMNVEEYENAKKLLLLFNFKLPLSWEGIDEEESESEVIDTTALTKEQYYALRQILALYSGNGLIIDVSHWYGLDNYEENYDRYPDKDKYELTEKQISKLMEIIDLYDNNELEIYSEWEGI